MTPTPVQQLNPDFVVWLLQYFTPTAITVMVLVYFVWKIVYGVLLIIQELKKMDKTSDNDN